MESIMLNKKERRAIDVRRAISYTESTQRLFCEAAERLSLQGMLANLVDEIPLGRHGLSNV